MKPRHTAEQSTVKVNKAEKMGKIGFAAISQIAQQPKAAVVTGGFASVTASVEPINSPLNLEQVRQVETVSVSAVSKIVASSSPISSKVPEVEQNATEELKEVRAETSKPVWKSLKDIQVGISQNVDSKKIDEKAMKEQKIMKTCPIDPQERLQCDSCQ